MCIRDSYVIVYAPTFRDIGDDRTQFKPDLDFDKLSKDLLPNQIDVYKRQVLMYMVRLDRQAEVM